LPIFSLTAQEDDLQSWTITTLSKKLNSKYSASVLVINRVDENISRYSSVSFDWRVRRHIKDGFSAQVSFRHWTFTQRKPVYFMWYDLIYVHKKPMYRWVNLLRFHQGLDWVDLEEPDFLRWRNHYFKNLKNSKLTPFVGYDLWYRLNDRFAFQRVWLEAGAEYKLGKTILRLNYRRVAIFKNQPGRNLHIIFTGFTYRI